jgi:hypothetical protein
MAVASCGVTGGATCGVTGGVGTGNGDWGSQRLGSSLELMGGKARIQTFWANKGISDDQGNVREVLRDGSIALSQNYTSRFCKSTN